MNDLAIEVTSLTKRFGRRTVLDGVSLRVVRGRTYAFLGCNGAGKTTTIRILLGLLRPDSGSAAVLGLNPARDALAVRRRVGYMAEDQAMFGWMRVAEVLRFMAPFYPTWDADLAGKLLGQFALPPRTRVRHLSKGESCRLALLLALAHRPELVILDDPTLGLDPIMRKQFLRDVVTHLQSAGATVFFSSHLLYEVEPVADEVAILDRGRIVVAEETERLRERVKQLVLPAEAYRRIGELPGALDVRFSGSQAAVVVGDAAEAMRAAAAAGVHPQINDLNLDEIFEAHVAGQREPIHDRQADLERVA